MKKTSLTQLAKLNGIARSTVQERIAKGMDKIDALCTPPDRARHTRKVTDAQIVAVMRLQLSISRSAYLLGISRITYRRRLKRIFERRQQHD